MFSIFKLHPRGHLSKYNWSDAINAYLQAQNVMNIKWDYSYYQPWSDNE